jgi:hypothetical protein
MALAAEPSVDTRTSLPRLTHGLGIPTLVAYGSVGNAGFLVVEVARLCLG